MTMSDYMRGVRALVGTTLLEVPTVSVLAFDDSHRVVLVRHVGSESWTTPGGMIEPGEIPADAALREMWEETGLAVRLTRIVGVFGGAACTSTYANGDRLSWVSTVFAATPLSGNLRPDFVETCEVRYFERGELASLECRPHVRLFLDAAQSDAREAIFQAPTWVPPSS